MSVEIPDRSGWLNEPLSSYPPVPPFPELTTFEARALDCLAEMLGSQADEFRKQATAYRVLDRVNTIVGFYTRVTVDRSVCSPLPILKLGGRFDVAGIEHGLGVILWGDEGYVETIEGYTYDDNALADRDLADLKFVACVQLG